MKMECRPVGVKAYGAVLLAAAALAGCVGRGEITEGGITAVRSVCPTVAIPAGTGDVTLFDPPASRDTAALDLSAYMTNVQSTCSDAGAEVTTTVTFDVEARRTRFDTARTVDLPYFITLVRGGSAVVAKRVGRVQLQFAAGADRARVSGQASTSVGRAAVTLPDDIRTKLTRRRKAGDEEAAIDPLSQPEIRQAVLRATFEALVGFQLSDEQLRYNATR